MKRENRETYAVSKYNFCRVSLEKIDPSIPDALLDIINKAVIPLVTNGYFIESKQNIESNISFGLTVNGGKLYDIDFTNGKFTTIENKDLPDMTNVPLVRVTRASKAIYGEEGIISVASLDDLDIADREKQRQQVLRTKEAVTEQIAKDNNIDLSNIESKTDEEKHVISSAVAMVNRTECIYLNVDQKFVTSLPLTVALQLGEIMEENFDGCFDADLVKRGMDEYDLGPEIYGVAKILFTLACQLRIYKTIDVDLKSEFGDIAYDYIDKTLNYFKGNEIMAILNIERVMLKALATGASIDQLVLTSHGDVVKALEKVREKMQEIYDAVTDCKIVYVEDYLELRDAIRNYRKTVITKINGEVDDIEERLDVLEENCLGNAEHVLDIEREYFDRFGRNGNTISTKLGNANISMGTTIITDSDLERLQNANVNDADDIPEGTIVVGSIDEMLNKMKGQDPSISEEDLDEFKNTLENFVKEQLGIDLSEISGLAADVDSGAHGSRPITLDDFKIVTDEDDSNVNA